MIQSFLVAQPCAKIGLSITGNASSSNLDQEKFPAGVVDMRILQVIRVLGLRAPSSAGRLSLPSL